MGVATGVILLSLLIILAFYVDNWAENRSDNKDIKRRIPRPPHLRGDIMQYRYDYEEKLSRNAEHGDIYAMADLVGLYWHGIHDKVDIDKRAALYWKKVILDYAKRGNIYAMSVVGKIHHINKSKPAGDDLYLIDTPLLFDLELSRQCYNAVLDYADKGDPEAYVAMFKAFNEYDKAGLNYLFRAAKLEHPDAYYFLMYVYHYKAHVEDWGLKYYNWIQKEGAEDIMFEWGRLGAYSTSVYAEQCQVLLGIYYHSRRDKSQDYFDKNKGKVIFNMKDPNVREAYKYYRMAAQLGNPEAINFLK